MVRLPGLLGTVRLPGLPSQKRHECGSRAPFGTVRLPGLPSQKRPRVWSWTRQPPSSPSLFASESPPHMRLASSQVGGSAWRCCALGQVAVGPGWMWTRGLAVAASFPSTKRVSRCAATPAALPRTRKLASRLPPLWRPSGAGGSESIVFRRRCRQAVGRAGGAHMFGHVGHLWNPRAPSPTPD